MSHSLRPPWTTSGYSQHWVVCLECWAHVRRRYIEEHRRQRCLELQADTYRAERLIEEPALVELPA